MGAGLRVALAAEGTRGDVHPILELAVALRARGHEAVVCAPPDFAESVEGRGVEFRAIGESIHAFLDAQSRAVAEGGLRLLRSVLSYMERTVALQFGQLPEATRGADLVIGAGVQAAAGSVAEFHGVPYRYLVYCPVILPSREHSPMLFPTRELPAWLVAALWRFTRFGFNAAMRGSINRHRAALGIGPITDVFDYLLSPHPVVAADGELATIPADFDRPVEQIPCLHPIEREPLPEKLEQFLRAGPPPVYIGFGSMTDPDADATTRMILDAVTRVGCRALISVGWAGLGRAALPSDAMVVGTVSHPELFSRVAAVVHHGGAGTTTTAARAGTPQVLVPHLADQFYWAKRVQALGVGTPPVLRSRLNANDLADAIRGALDNEWLSERASALGARLREAAGQDPTKVFLD